MTEIVANTYRYRENTLVKLAQEIAMNIHPLEDILKVHQIDQEQWQDIQNLPRFQGLLEAEMIQWNGSPNTHERVRMKSAALMEQFLPEIFERMHDRSESLNAKIEAGKLVAKLAGMGITSASDGGGGEGFKVTINLGADQKLTFEKASPMKTIDGEVVESS